MVYLDENLSKSNSLFIFLLNEKITDLSFLNYKVVDKLRENNIFTIRDLILKSKEDLLSIKGMGKMKVLSIQNGLKSLGLSLLPEEMKSMSREAMKICLYEILSNYSLSEMFDLGKVYDEKRMRGGVSYSGGGFQPKDCEYEHILKRLNYFGRRKVTFFKMSEYDTFSILFNKEETVIKSSGAKKCELFKKQPLKIVGESEDDMSKMTNS